MRTLLPLLLVACTTSSPAPQARAPGDWSDAERDMLSRLRLTDVSRPSPSNRVADDPVAARLGQALFFDSSLSPSGEVSCATCHNPALGFSDGRPVSRGVGSTTRNAPAIPGSQVGPWFFWDGRADSLWAQAAGPVESAVEMGSDRMFVARQVLARHRETYEQVFGAAPDLSEFQRFPAHARPDEDADLPVARAWASMEPGDRDRVTGVFVNAMKAVAAYERTLVLTDAPFDHYVDAVLAGRADGDARLGDAEVRGLSLFLRSGCTDCHHGPTFSDRAFHNLGLVFSGPFDAGRSVGATQVLEHELGCRSRWSDTKDCPELDFLDPTFPDFQQAFKTPTLRNVARTPPYMHHGELASLHDVVTFYSELPGDAAVNHRELTLQPLGLSEADKQDLVAFLVSLTGEPLPADRVRAP